MSIEQVKTLREQSGISVQECQRALNEAGGDLEKAKEILRKWGKAVAEKKAAREVKSGLVETYVHPNKKVGVMMEIDCETDFVAKADDFKSLAHELCLQAAGFADEEMPFLEQPWIKDPGRTVKDLIQECIAKVGENITVKRFVRYQI
jgi:elongation factor Ts